MKKQYLLIGLVIVLSFILSLCVAEEVYSESDSTFVFPYELLEIDEGAFEGTAVEVVVLPKGFLKIGSGAFEKVDNLKVVYIPDTTVEIAESAFPENGQYVIHGVIGSYAEKWADWHGIRFVEEDIWRIISERGEQHGHRRMRRERDSETFDSTSGVLFHIKDTDRHESFRPQDRPELVVVDWRFP